MKSTLYYVFQQSFGNKFRSQICIHTHKNPIDLKDDGKVLPLLDDLFAAWNKGSGKECAIFQKYNQMELCHSLSVDDVIALSDAGEMVEGLRVWYYWKCGPSGWQKLDQVDFQNLESFKYRKYLMD